MFKTYLPIRWIGHLPIDDFGRIILLNVEFDSAFGPFQRGEVVECIEIDFVIGTIQERDIDTQKPLRFCQFVAIPDRRQGERREERHVEQRRNHQSRSQDRKTKE